MYKEENIILSTLLPTYYEAFSKNISKAVELNGYSFELCTLDGSDIFEIWYYGDINEDSLIVGNETSLSKVVARSVSTGEEIVIFDGITHGYDNLTWQEHTEIIKIERPLKKLNFGYGKILIEFELLEDNENDWDLDDDRNVTTDNGKKIPWEDFKRNAITWLQIYIITKAEKKIKIFCEELA